MAGISQSGVHLRYHEPVEYNGLTDAQKMEVAKWQKAQGIGRGRARSQATIAVAVNHKVQNKFAAAKSKKTEKGINDILSDKA